jgi:hypothetical protein
VITESFGAVRPLGTVGVVGLAAPRTPDGTDARPVLTGGLTAPCAPIVPVAPARSGVAGALAVSAPPSGFCSLGASGGGGMPGALVYFGAGVSAGTLARPTTARPVAEPLLALSAPSAASPSTGEVEVAADPDVACVSVIN